MKNRITYAVVAGMALAAIGAVSQAAIAGDTTYFRVLSPLTPITQRSVIMSGPSIETTVGSSVVIDKTVSTATVVTPANCTPVMLERTSVARPHHFLSFGVWP